MAGRRIYFDTRKQSYEKDGKTITPKTDPYIIMQVFDARFAGRKFFYSTKRSVKKSEWKSQFPADLPHLSPLRAHLKELRNTAEDWLDSKARSKTLDKTEIRNLLDNVGKDEIAEQAIQLEKETDFFKNWEQIIDTTKHPKTGKPISETSKSTKKQTVGKFKEFCVDTNLKPTLLNIDLSVYHAFDQHMIDKGLKPNTRGKHHKELKAFLRECLERDYEVNRSFQKKAFKVVKEDVDDVYWTKPDIQCLMKLEEKLPKQSAELCAHIIVACFTGLRHSDWSQHDPQNIVVHGGKEMFKVKQQKGGADVYIPLHPVVKMYLNKYGKLRNISNQKMNENLKAFCGQAEFTDPRKASESSCHTTRRSFCTNAYLSKSLPTQTIMKISGHKSEASFLRYLKLGPLEHAILAAESDFFTDEGWTTSLKVVA